MAGDNLFDSMLSDVESGTFKPEMEKPETPDPIFDDLIQKEQSKTAEQNYVSAMRASRADPEKYAQDKSLGDTLGVPVDVVGRNRERLQKFKGVQDARRFFDDNPVLGKFYAQDDNADAVKVDELRQFSGMSWLAMASIDAFSQGIDDVNLGNARYEELMGRATGDQIKAYDKISAAREPRTFGADTWMQQGYVGSLQQLPNMGYTLLGGLKGGAAGAVAGSLTAAVVGQLGPQVALPEELITVPGGAAIGFRIGSTAGHIQASFRLQAGLAYDEFKGIKDTNGKPLDPEVAKGAAIVSGGIGSILETIGFEAMAKIVPGLDKIAGNLSRDGVKAALQRPTVAAALKTFASNIAKSGATEVSTEVMQEGIQIFAGEMAKSIASGEGTDFQMLTSREISERIGQTFEQTLQSMTIMGPALSGTRLGSDIRRARRAAQDVVIIDAINQHAQGNELNARLPEKTKEVIRAVTEDGPVKAVYVDPKAISTFFQTSEEIGAYTSQIGLTEEYNEASRTGRDMEIPIDVYYSSIAGTEIGQALRGAVKLDPDRMNMNEADDFNAAWQEAAQHLMDQQEDAQRYEKMNMDANALIHEDVKAKAMDAGIVPDQAEQYAKLYSTFFRVMSERTGEAPDAIYSRYGFDIKRAIPGWETEYKPVDGLALSLEVMRRGGVDGLRKKVEKAKGASLLDRVKERGGIEDTGGDLASMDLPKGIVRKSSTGQGSLLSGAGDNQFSADDTARQLWEEGYFPEFQERPTANDLFDAIAEEAGGNKRFKPLTTVDKATDRAAGLVNFADELDRLGLDPKRMTDDEIRAELERIVADDPDTGALYQNAVDGVRELYQEGTQQGEETGGVKRGSIQFSEGRTIINMFEAANPSTFLHESGHFFLEVFRDLASKEPIADMGPQTQLAQDWQTTREFLGITDDANISVDAHEKFARSFEAYLFEGKAPSNEVASIFGRFRSWLVFVYQSVKNINAPINDKIRGVMDRLVATDDEIRMAQSGADFRPAFSSAEEAGMTDAQWKDYVETAGRAVEKAKRELGARMLQDVARETTKEWREAKKAIREQVSEEYGKLPVYQAIQYLRTGESSMVPEGMERIHLDRDAIVDVMGEGALQKMPKGVPPLYRATGGYHPDIFAELFGFQSGHEFLERVMSVPPINRAVVEETNVRMKQQFGDLMGDAVARAREVSAALDNDATGDLLAKEMEVLLRKGLVTSSVRKEDAQRVAREAVRGKTIREAIRTKLYQNANMRAAQEAERAILKQDWKAAVAAKQRQLLNHYMSVEAANAEKDTEKAVRYLNKFAGRKRPNGVDPEYLDQIEGILERFDLRKSVTLKDTQRRASLAAWIQEREAQGDIVDVPDALRRDAFRKPYREMTVDDLMAVRDAVKNIEHLGRLKDKLLANKERREFEGARDELLASLEATQDKKKESKTRNPTPIALGLEYAQSLEATQLKMEQVFDWMDGGDINGPFNRYIWRPIAEAEAAENEMRAKYSAKLALVFNKLDKDRLSARITIPGLEQTYKRSEIMAVALNMGNESNLDKMLRGEGWNEQILDRVVSNLNDAEWAAVQEVWDTINSLWPDVAALQKRLAGVEPTKIEARKFVTPGGKQMSGGYYPAIYDPRRAADVEDRAAANSDLFIENTYLRPDTPRGFTKERAQMYARPMLFDLDGIANHINGVIHDLTHREAIMDAVKFITNAPVRNEIETRYGKAIYQQMMPWLQSIARDQSQNDGLAAVNRLFRSIRSRATMVAMGFRISTMLAQIGGLSSSAEMVPVKHMAGSIKDFVRNPAAMWREVDGLSGEMKFRAETLDRDIKERLRELTGATSAADRARRFAFYGIGYLDRVVTVPTWMGAYRDHLSRYPTDKEGAIAHADKVVRLTQGSGGAKDLSALQRKNELTKLVTMFYSYFSAYYNRQRAWGRDAKRAVQQGDVREFPQLLARQVFMTIGPALLGELLVGKGPGDDEDWEKWALKKASLYPVMAVPIARDFANYFSSGFGYSLSPAERTLTDTVIKPIELIGDIVEGEADPRKAAKVVINATGLWFNLPTGQIATSVDNVWKAIEEDDFQLRDIVLSRPAK